MRNLANWFRLSSNCERHVDDTPNQLQGRVIPYEYLAHPSTRRRRERDRFNRIAFAFRLAPFFFAPSPFPPSPAVFQPHLCRYPASGSRGVL